MHVRSSVTTQLFEHRSHSEYDKLTSASRPGWRWSEAQAHGRVRRARASWAGDDGWTRLSTTYSERTKREPHLPPRPLPSQTSSSEYELHRTRTLLLLHFSRTRSRPPCPPPPVLLGQRSGDSAAAQLWRGRVADIPLQCSPFLK
jgi:hypothetical protein